MFAFDVILHCPACGQITALGGVSDVAEMACSKCRKRYLRTVTGQWIPAPERYPDA